MYKTFCVCMSLIYVNAKRTGGICSTRAVWGSYKRWIWRRTRSQWLRAAGGQGLSERCYHQMARSVWDLLGLTTDSRRQRPVGRLLLAPPAASGTVSRSRRSQPRRSSVRQIPHGSRAPKNARQLASLPERNMKDRKVGTAPF